MKQLAILDVSTPHTEVGGWPQARLPGGIGQGTISWTIHGT